MSIALFIEYLKEFAQAYYPVVALVGTVLTLLFGILRHGLWAKVWSKIRDFWRTDVRLLKGQNAKLTQQLDRVRDAFDDDNNLWLRNPVTKPDRYDTKLQASIPILLVANLKGGVGKTTIAANLANYFERRKGERVLAIDLDHQGSLSSMLLPEAIARTQRPAEAVKALIGSGPGGQAGFFAGTAQIRHSLRDSRLIECDDAFGNFETRLILEWLIGDRQEDIRYNLARVLHSPEVQQSFDRIIIDAPPRMTTGFVNALCASTYLVVPFVLDILSAERVGLFLRTVRRMRGQLFPHLELAGVVGTLKGDSTDRLREAEQNAIAAVERGVSDAWGPGDYVLKDALIPRKQSIADTAGIGIDLSVATIFEQLGARLFDLTTRSPAGNYESGSVAAASRRARGGSRYEGELAGYRNQQI